MERTELAGAMQPLSYMKRLTEDDVDFEGADKPLISEEIGTKQDLTVIS